MARKAKKLRRFVNNRIVSDLIAAAIAYGVAAIARSSAAQRVVARGRRRFERARQARHA